MIIMEMRFCTKCKTEKELNLFIKNKQCAKGRAFICRQCQNTYSKNWKRSNTVRLAKRRRELYCLEYGQSSKQRITERARVRAQLHPFITRARIMRNGLLQRSKNGVLVDLKTFSVRYIVELLQKQKTCACCHNDLDIGYKFDGRAHDNSPSLDRVIPIRGYVLGNVALLCWRCNNLKRDSNPQELRMIANWIEVWGNDEKLNLKPLESYSIV